VRQYKEVQNSFKGVCTQKTVETLYYSGKPYNTNHPIKEIS
jgi:hypothetical protein